MQIVNFLKALDFYFPFPILSEISTALHESMQKGRRKMRSRKGKLDPTKIFAGFQVKHSRSKSLITTCPSDFQTFLWLCNRTIAGGTCKMKMKNAGHSLAMAHPEFAEVQIDNLSVSRCPSRFYKLPTSFCKKTCRNIFVPNFYFLS